MTEMNWTDICIFNSVQFSCSVVSNSLPTLHVHHQLPKLTQTHVHWVGDAIQPSRPLSSPSPPTFNLSQHQGLFQWVGSLHQVAKVLEFQLQHQSFQYSGLISFRMDWLDLLAVQGTLKDLLQHHSSKASILWHSAFFIVQLSHPYMTIGKPIPLIRWIFVGKVTSLLFNMLSITFFETNYHKFSGLKEQNCILSRFRRPEIWNQGVGRATLSPKALEEHPSLLLLVPSASNLCFHLHTAFSSLSYEDTCHWI